MAEWLWPNGTKTEPRVNSPWDMHREHPVYKDKNGDPLIIPHYGTDLHIPDGINRSVTDGTVTRVGVVPGWAGGGYGVWVKNWDGSLAKYFHGVTGSAYVTVGDKVKAGDPLCRTGMTGAATGVHLHLEISPNGGPNKQVDPEPFLRSRIAETAGGDEKPFEPDVPAEEEEDDMPKNTGVATQRGSDKVWLYMVFNYGSGIGHEFNSGSEKPIDGATIDSIAKAFDTTPWAKVSESHYNVIKLSLAKVAQVDVTLTGS